MSRHASPDMDQTLGALRDEFRKANGIPDSTASFEWIKLGPVPVPVPIPNPPARRRALRIHDLHHLVTGYRTDLAGEAQISAWECGAGLGGEAVAWVFCPSGTLGGMLRRPRPTVAAYARGRRARSLFGQDPEVVDSLTLDAANAWCRTGVPAPEPTLRDWAGAVGWACFGIISLVLPPVAVAVGRAFGTGGPALGPP
jgi:hypothetical protein